MDPKEQQVFAEGLARVYEGLGRAGAKVPGLSFSPDTARTAVAMIDAARQRLGYAIAAVTNEIQARAEAPQPGPGATAKPETPPPPGPPVDPAPQQEAAQPPASA